MGLHKFNKEKALNKLRFNLNKGIYIKTSSIIISIVLIISFIMIFTFAKFSTTNKYNIIQTTVGDFSSGDYSIAYYVDNTLVDTLPTSTSGKVIEKITCTNNGTATWNKDTWNIEITSKNTHTACNVYFNSDSSKEDTSYYTAINTSSDDYKAGSNMSSTDVIGKLVNGNVGTFTTTKYYKVVIATTASIQGYDFGYNISVSGTYTNGLYLVSDSSPISDGNTGVFAYTYYGVQSGTIFTVTLPMHGTHDSLIITGIN